MSLFLLNALAQQEPPARLGRVKKLWIQVPSEARYKQQFIHIRKAVLVRKCPFTGCGASDVMGRSFQCLLRGLSVRCPSRAYSSPRLSRES